MTFEQSRKAGDAKVAVIRDLMPQAPEISGGAGFSFEDTGVARYLAALLGEGSAPGLSGRVVTRVAVQQAAFGEPLDDLVVDGIATDETTARLSLQAKRRLTVSSAPSNEDFREIVSHASATLTQADFREDRDRVGAVTGTISEGVLRALVEVCEWARDSRSLDSFLARFRDGVAGEERRAILETFRTILGEAGADDVQVYRLLRHFVLIRLDMLHEGATSEAAVIEQLRTHLHETDAYRASDLWARLLAIARAAAGRSGEFSRASLLCDLQGSFRFAGAPSLINTLRRVSEEARLSLGSICGDILGTNIERPALNAAIAEALERHRFVQLVGLPGTGKSAALRAFAEFKAQKGTVLVLKSDRLTGVHWAAYGQSVGLAPEPIDTILIEIAATGSPILFIDGIDRVELPNRGIITDLIQTVLDSPRLSNWKIIATCRDNGIEPLRTWLPDRLLSGDGVASIDVKPFDDDEAAKLADAIPALRPLLFGETSVRDIVRRPFFVSVLCRAFPQATPESAPRSEIELMDEWWQGGGYDSRESQASRRQRALIALAKVGAMTLGRRMRLEGIDLDALAELKADGVISDVRTGHSVQFTHDIFFEWSFVHLLIDREEQWIEEILVVGEPPVLGRAVELLAQIQFPVFDEWEGTLRRLEGATLRPQWLRSWITGPFGDPAFLARAAKFTELMTDDNARQLAKLLVWFQAEKTRTNPRILESPGATANLSPREIVRLADELAWPSDLGSWNRFCLWLLNNIERFPTKIIPDVLSVFEVWQNMLSGYSNKVSERIVALARTWLEDLEDREHEDHPGHRDRGRWIELRGGERKELEDRLRNVLLGSAQVESFLVHNYLRRVSARERLRNHAFAKIIKWSPRLAASHPQELVELTLAELKGDFPGETGEEDDEFGPYPRSLTVKDWHDLAIRDYRGLCFPASPLREPFASLFQNSPQHGLTLVRELTNHAIEAWRRLHLAPIETKTPIRHVLQFPWGEQIFFGDQRVYMWPRGYWAPPTILSGLMTLEKWAFEEVAGGRDVDAVIEDVVAGCDACAVLSIAVALALNSDQVSDVTLPLATSQRLWSYDIVRYVSESQSRTTLIGFKPHETSHAEAVHEANSRPIRHKEIRWLAQLFVLCSNEKLRELARSRIQNFPNDLPFEYEEEMNDQAHVAKLTRTAEIWSEFGDIENYRATPAPDGKGVLIGLENPRASDPDVMATIERSTRMNREFGLLTWINDSFEQRKVSSKLSLNEAIAQAKSLNRTDLYDVPHGTDDTFDLHQSLVGGVAAVISRYAENPDFSDLTWSTETLFRSCGTREHRSEFWSAGAILPHHPCLYTVYGLSGLIQRGTELPKAQAGLITLAGHPSEQISETALNASQLLWSIDSNFAWIGLSLAIRLSIGTREGPIAPFGYDHSTRPDRMEAAVKAALNELASGQNINTLHHIPVPWVFEPPKRRGGSFFDRGRAQEPIWREPDEFLRWDFLPKIFRSIRVDLIMNDRERRPAFLSFCFDLLNWTIERLNPSWCIEERQRPGRQETMLFGWQEALFRLLAQVALHLETEEAQSKILDPVFRQEDEIAASLLRPLVEWITITGILDAEEISPRSVPLLQSCLGRVLQDHSWEYSRHTGSGLHSSEIRDLIKHFLFISIESTDGAARFANGDWRDIGVALPILDRVVRSVGDIADVMSAFLTLAERAINHYPEVLFVEQVAAILSRSEGTPPGWRNTGIPGRIAALVHAFAERAQPVKTGLAQQMLRILDRLIDMGDRRSAALQTSEIFKAVRV